LKVGLAADNFRPRNTVDSVGDGDMPTYEYKCGSCGHQFEKFSPKITDTSTVACPRCDGIAERLISGGAGILFKGSGFYATDYRSQSYKEAANKEQKTPAKETPSSESAPASSAKKGSKKDSE
jgi:putative FmdB family regulatory protein